MDALLTTFGIDWHLLVAQAINFGILVGLLTWFLYKPVLKMVREREQLIAKGVEDAEQAEAKLKGADEEVAKRVVAADVESASLVSSAREVAQAERTRILKEAEVRASKMAEDAQVRAEETSTRALRESEREIARLAILAAEKIVREKS